MTFDPHVYPNTFDWIVLGTLMLSLLFCLGHMIWKRM